MKTGIAILMLLGAVVSGAALYANRPATPLPSSALATVTVRRGDLTSTISATGTIEPEDVVDVGAQVMGSVLEFGPDLHGEGKLIDYGSVVEKGTVLARIDSIPYEVALEQAEATLERSEADLLQLEAKCDQAEQEFKRAETLLGRQAITMSSYDLAVANHKSAKANLAVGKASIRLSKAAVRVAQTNLSYTTIRSPVHGVVIDRRVNIGQTVVASLNAPSLFLIATDLKRLQVWASVNEADIGQIRLDMPVRFTVDAHAGQVFLGKVTQIRLNATMTQNVVTYTVVVTTDNSDGKLLPYLTANVQFELEQRSKVLLVPNAALRWQPQTSQIDPARRTETTAVESMVNEDHGCIWVPMDSGFVSPLKVLIGTSDGTNTEVSGAGVKEGMQTVIGESGADDESDESEASDAGDKANSPFLPKPPKGSGPPPAPF